MVDSRAWLIIAGVGNIIWGLLRYWIDTQRVAGVPDRKWHRWSSLVLALIGVAAVVFGLIAPD